MKQVSFEVAKLAKEKGFMKFGYINQIDGEFYYYTKEGKLESNYYKNGSGSKYGALMNHPDVGAKYSDACEAPTQSELQAWLRDVHNLVLYPIPVTYSLKGWMIKGIHRLGVMEENKLFISEFADTYEQALEMGLLEALKLI